MNNADNVNLKEEFESLKNKSEIKIKLCKNIEDDKIYKYLCGHPDKVKMLMNIFDMSWEYSDADYMTKQEVWRKLYEMASNNGASASQFILSHMMDMNNVRPNSSVSETNVIKKAAAFRSINEIDETVDKKSYVRNSRKDNDISEEEMYDDLFNDEITEVYTGRTGRHILEEITYGQPKPDDRFPGWYRFSSKKDPVVGRKYYLCGYLYPGVIEMTVGRYHGDKEWEIWEFPNDYRHPEFKVLYWRPVDLVPESVADEIAED